MKRTNSFQLFVENTKRARSATPSKVACRPELRGWFYEAITPDLDAYRESHTQACAFNASHEDTPFRVSHYGKVTLDEMIDAFIALYPGCETLVPREVWHATYDELWLAHHRKYAKMRLLCATCYREAHPKFKERTQKTVATPQPSKSVNEVLVPYSEKSKIMTPHPWLDIATWRVSPTRKGDYVRKLDGHVFQLYARHRKWLYVYKGKFSEKGYDSLQEVLDASYAAFGAKIRRFVST